MPKANKIFVALTVAFFALSSPPGFAETAEDYVALRPLTITQADARRIAWRYGIVRIEEIGLSDDRWQVAGRDSQGDELVIDIDARNGSVSR